MPWYQQVDWSLVFKISQLIVYMILIILVGMKLYEDRR